MIHISLVVPWSLIIENYSNLLRKLTSRDGNGAGWGQRMESSPPPCMIVLPYSYPIPVLHDGKNFLALSLSFGASRSAVPSRKTLFFVNLPTIFNFFLIKPISLIKIYLKLQINLSHQIKLIFSKYWIILSNCLTRHYHNKNKNIMVQNQWFNGI